MMTYCQYLREHPENTFHKDYHDNEYGFPLKDDSALFERLVLEINQAGLSARLLADAGIIRNRLKVHAAIENANRIQNQRTECGSFKGWLDGHHPLNLEEWTKLFKRTFVFTGGEIVNEFLVSTGYLPGAHDQECFVYQQILKLDPAWTRS
jgi:DNA-3-methyladenine glycosylase I